MCYYTIFQRYYNIPPCWSFSTAGIMVHFRSSRYVAQAMWCWLGKSSYVEQGMKLYSVGDAVIHQLSGSHAMVPQIRVLPVKLPHAGCSRVVNSN